MTASFPPLVAACAVSVAVVAVVAVCSTLAALRVTGAPVLRVPRVDDLPFLRGIAAVRRAAHADRELPDVLEGVARALRGGATLPAALAAGRATSSQLLRDEWSRLVSAAVDVGVAIAADRWTMARTSRSIELAASALAVAADVGGPQARMLDSVATTLRQRLAVDAELHALTAQARASATVLAIAPLGFAAIAGGLEPRYLSFLLGTPVGWLFLAAGVALLVIGLAWMARITRVAP